jgi:hypothetical protein
VILRKSPGLLDLNESDTSNRQPFSQFRQQDPGIRHTEYQKLLLEMWQFMRQAQAFLRFLGKLASHFRTVHLPPAFYATVALRYTAVSNS